MSDNKITQDQLEPNVMEELESGIGDLSTLSTENKDSLVAAVTEIYGKNVIAEAIGEPLAVTDTFSEMGSEINSLLSSFKTNMMNSGVTVESGDKFKQLIDKIKGLTEGEGNKGIQYAEGVNTISHDYLATGRLHDAISNLEFKPTVVFVHVYEITAGTDGTLQCSVAPFTIDSLHHYDMDTLFEHKYHRQQVQQAIELQIYVNTIDNGFQIFFDTGYTGRTHFTFNWYAIGVGEEDTTLRDSLASILEEEGVGVTEEDDMASLISKVDEEFDRQVVPQGNATAADVIAGKTFINDTGQLLTGTATLQSLGGEKSKQLIINWNITESENLFMIKNDGSLWAYGFNYYGGLGLGDNTNRTTFTKVTTNINNDVKQVACGKYHTFILKNDGSVWACGYNYDGQLGLGTSGNGTNRTTFTQVTTNINNDVKQIACGAYHTFILKNDGSLWSCGDNGSGQLGLGDTTDRTTFTQVTTNINNDVKELLCFDNKTHIIKNDDSIWIAGLMFDYSQTTFMQI